MEHRRFLIETYLTPDAHFHFARKSLSEAAPELVHDHDYFELCLVVRGGARHLINGEEEMLGRGDLLFLRPADCHALQALSGGCEILNVMFREETAAHLGARYAQDFAGRFFWKVGGLPARVALSGATLERAVNVSLDLQTAIRSLARVEHYLLQIMLHVVPHVAHLERTAPAWLLRACQASQSPEVFRQGAAGFIAAAGRGHEHVCRQSARHLGMSPTAFVNRARMQYAALRLGRDGETVEDIARDCGISNLSHFYKLFRAHYGTTPRAYRLRHQRDPARARP